ncbi:Lrp/AsnC family transcriptional regulator [Natronocalculus amylovorans]|uniref:Lrp/AsnC ligand binding domain-containing protein n=1 Tax=Natronocalculus amylovorans TaxID=2917812 RepID=A0AAE3K895_9EURY|nr:Lrp/AsnC ligand binding domain-containing protein [Natronocalculus amylovorans]MCL9816280.1 Lrp/AsnC ligand binding domain-containing protein [Natronocalculus amylovorans]NUE03370.1 Lrp/AsnC family transcriptional regulator [Halorubraceae archaeon YAN]
MDERDITLLKAISDLETGSPEKLHEETGIPISTIHYRLSNLKEEGVLKNDLYDIDLEKFGIGVTVIVEILVDYSGSYEELGEQIEAIEGVTQVFFTMGETDFIAVARLTGRKMVERLIRQFEEIEEVERTNSTFVISPLKDTHRALQSYSLETLLDELDESRVGNQ